MEKIYLTRRYFKNPVYTITILLAIFILFEGLSWALTFEKKITKVSDYGGILGYTYVLLRGGIIPELATLIISLFLIDFAHTWLKIYTVRFTCSAILRYELTFLPVLALAFFLFNPITQSIRYLLVNYPTFDFSIYWDRYIVTTYSLRIYSIYIIPVLLLGYISINLSLLHDLYGMLKSGNTEARCPIKGVE